MLASDSGKPDRSRRVDKMTKESTPEYGSEKLKDTEIKDNNFSVTKLTNERELLCRFRVFDCLFYENKH